MSPTDHFSGEEPTKAWTLADVYADLGTREDIARSLNIKPRRVVNFIVRRERIKSPMPIKRLGPVDVYSIQEWRDWFAAWCAKHRQDTKWMDGAAPHGSGESFWAYFDNVE